MSVNLDFDLPRKKFKKCDFEIQDIKEDIKNTSISESLRIGVLSTKNLRPDVFLLGTITGFSKYSIVVSLPNLITGHVRFVDTNPLINSLLAKDSNLKINEFFNAYQYVCCSLVSNCSNMISSKLFFTMNPNEIYADLGIDDLTEGMVIWGFIVTTEEFGYEMAFGLGNFKGFLIDKKKQLKVGSMLLVSVVSIHQELNIIKVCSKKKTFSNTKIKNASSIRNFYPGQLCKAIITKSTISGLQLLVNGNYEASASSLHLGSHSAAQILAPNQEVDARVIFYDQMAQHIGLSLCEHLLRFAKISLFDRQEIVGNTFDVKILKSLKNYGFVVGFDDSFYGLIKIKNKNSSKLVENYSIGEIHLAIVTKFYLFENIFEVTTKTDNLTAISQIKPGHVYKGVVYKIAEKYIIVNIGCDVFGKISLNELPIGLNDTRSLNSYKISDVILCRVTLVDIMQNTLKLSALPQFVNNRLPLITDLSLPKKGNWYCGRIKSAQGSHYVVSFGQNIRGILPYYYISRNVEVNLKKGYVIDVMFLKKNSKTNNLLLSTYAHFSNFPVLSTGIYTVKRTFGRDGTLMVELDHFEHLFEIDSNNMSDFRDLCPFLYELAKLDIVVSKKVFIDSKNKIVSFKKSLIESFESGLFSRINKNIRIDFLYTGYIEDRNKYGYKVYLTTGSKAFVPFDNTKLNLLIKDSCVVKIIKTKAWCGLSNASFFIPQPLNNYLFSYLPKSSFGFGLVENYINLTNFIVKNKIKCNKSQYPLIGNSVDTELVSSSDGNLIVRFDSFLGNVTVKNEGKYIKGSSLSVTVCYWNFEDSTFYGVISSNHKDYVMNHPVAPIVLPVDIMKITPYYYVSVIIKQNVIIPILIPRRPILCSNSLIKDKFLVNQIIDVVINKFHGLLFGESLYNMKFFKHKFSSISEITCITPPFIFVSNKGNIKKLHFNDISIDLPSGIILTDLFKVRQKLAVCPLNCDFDDENVTLLWNYKFNGKPNSLLGKTGVITQKSKYEIALSFDREHVLRIHASDYSEKDWIHFNKTIKQWMSLFVYVEDLSGVSERLKLNNLPDITTEIEASIQKKFSLNIVPRSESRHKLVTNDILQEETFIRKFENSFESVKNEDYYRKQVLSYPNDDLKWIEFMAYYISNMDINKSREVSNRALQTINYRNHQSKENIFLARLNLELKYGNETTLRSVIDDSVKVCNVKKIFNVVCSFFEISKPELAELYYKEYIKKIPFKKKPYISYVRFLIRINKRKDAAIVIKKCFHQLEKRKHISCRVQFAIIEFKFGDKQIAVTMFDSILNENPKRIDIWCSYIDQLIISKQVDSARVVFQRIIHLELPESKKLVLLKKCLNFEKNSTTNLQDLEYYQDLIKHMKSS